MMLSSVMTIMTSVLNAGIVCSSNRFIYFLMIRNLYLVIASIVHILSLKIVLPKYMLIV